MSAAFLVAKYVRDIERQEPENFGVILWVKGRVAYKFMKPGEADFVEDSSNFQRWIDYWQGLAEQKRLQVFAERPATLNSVRFLRQIQMTQNGNYRLQDGGEVPDATADNLPEVAAFLYDRLVSRERHRQETREPTLQSRCNDFLREAGLLLLDDFHQRYEVVLNIDGLERAIHFDYGRGDGEPLSLLNRVNLSEENSVILAAGKCGAAIQYRKCRKDRCFSLYDSSREDGDFDASVHFLNTFSVPVDIANKANALLQLQPIIVA